MKKEKIMENIKKLGIEDFLDLMDELETYKINIVNRLYKNINLQPVSATEIVKEPVIEKEHLNKKERCWTQYFEQVREIGISHGEETKEMGIITSAVKDTDNCVMAALVGHRGKATNLVWGTSYKYPMLFAKTSLEELETYKKELLNNLPEDAFVLPELNNDNGNINNFYYDELEEGNFIARFTNEEGKINYIGYMVDYDVCFFVNENNEIAANTIKYFFVRNWGKREDIEKEILNLIDRAFNKKNIVKEIKEEIKEQAKKVVKHEKKAVSNEKHKKELVMPNLKDFKSKFKDENDEEEMEDFAW